MELSCRRCRSALLGSWGALSAVPFRCGHTHRQPAVLWYRGGNLFIPFFDFFFILISWRFSSFSCDFTSTSILFDIDFNDFFGFASVLASAPTRLVQPMLDAANAPVDSEVAVNAIFGCASASWLAARAFTTTTLSVGEFQWEYKETCAGVITTRYMQGPVEELDICLQDGQFELISGSKKIRIGGNSQLSEEEANWVFQSISAQQSLPRRLSL